MKSNKKNENKPEGTPGEEQVSVALEEKSEIKKHLQEQGSMDICEQSQKNSSEVDQETPQTA